ncbi:23S rRNA (guanine(745)-N(1))-methyltransferase [Pseudoalteromonas sp. CnMc7-15]|uniref:23S rRNA (guanine(745)-N(1))-methyltransferase n=1 Tax=unclassified Pseudoalteromonas TaxID=194690 RepID=UPI001EF6C66A|nr:23S rRNA (guanine(745)-N(1))-methyltransferase [Pseudoalteromonas sp. CnMc7-15]MCG7564726.1 23S rRNA (guanine(745)-N(1))-methyltransferase [Pseudoalteromonas sp. CnMc7-15]
MSAYCCPLCQQPLQRQNQALVCAKGHQFDYAKEGYVNLLPVQFKKSKQPGDNQDMVQARRRFLNAGHYQFMRDALAREVSACYSGTGYVVDMGCGEGYYSAAMAAQFQDPELVHGIDIAKPAVRYGAKRYPGCQFAVASTKQMPMASGCASVVSSVFAPIFADESARLLQDNGHLIVVSPGPRHLAQLKALIYQQVREHTAPDTPPGFNRQRQQLLQQQISLPGEDARDLALMTPFAWKFSEIQMADLASADEVTIDAEFFITVYQKIS